MMFSIAGTIFDGAKTEGGLGLCSLLPAIEVRSVISYQSKIYRYLSDILLLQCIIVPFLC